MKRSLVVGAWAALAPMVGFALLRLLGFEARSASFTALLTVTLWVLAPAWVVLGVGVALRDRRLATVAAAVAALHLLWVTPDLRWWPHDQPDARGDQLEVVATNLLHANEVPDEAAAELQDMEPDVLVATELTPATHAALGSLGLRHVAAEPRTSPDAFGIGVYSRFPIEASEVLDLAGAPALRVTIRAGGTSVNVVGVHTLQPLADDDRWRRQLDRLASMAAETDGPLVMAGDFNATRQHAPFRAVLEAGLDDAHLERGRGRATTWRAGGRLPPLALLDHVLVSDDVAVRAVGERRIPGSDHRAVRATIQLPA